MKRLANSVVLTAALVATLGLPSTAPAAAKPTPPPIITSRLVPVAGTFFANGENIALSGAVLVVTRVVPPNPTIPVDPCQIYVALGATGMGQTSGGRYYAYGDALTQSATPLPGTYAFAATFRLTQVGRPSPPPIYPLPLRFSVTVRPDLTMGATSAQIGAGSVDS